MKAIVKTIIQYYIILYTGVVNMTAIHECTTVVVYILHYNR